MKKGNKMKQLLPILGILLLGGCQKIFAPTFVNNTGSRIAVNLYAQPLDINFTKRVHLRPNSTAADSLCPEKISLTVNGDLVMRNTPVPRGTRCNAQFTFTKNRQGQYRFEITP